MKEQIVTGKKFRILADVTSRLWHVISFWTKAQDVEFNDGTNAQSKLGNIVGISDSLTSTASNVAASAKAVKVLNDKVVNQIGNLNEQIANKNNQITTKDQTIQNLTNRIEELEQLSTYGKGLYVCHGTSNSFPFSEQAILPGIKAGMRVAIYAWWKSNRDPWIKLTLGGVELSGYKPINVNFTNCIGNDTDTTKDVSTDNAYTKPYIFTAPHDGDLIISVGGDSQGGTVIYSITSIVAFVI